MRDTLFISHATPEDNNFSIWLASRLKMLGYKVWIDKEKLLGGETIWNEIQNIIKNNAVKILFAYSKNICDQDGNLKGGINKEISYAESIAKSEKLKDFIIPLHIDKDASYHEFIGANVLTHIPFYDNWASGLDQLKEKLEQCTVPKNIIECNSLFAEWYEEKYITDCSVIKKQEQLFSSWWRISKIPATVYLYIFKDKESAEIVKRKNDSFPIGIINNVLTSFDNDLNISEKYEFGEYKIEPERVVIHPTNNIIQGFETVTFPSYRDVKNHLTNFLNIIMAKLLLGKGLLSYKLSHGEAYFLPKGNEFTSIKFIYPETDIKKRKNIGGTYIDIGFWHYAISVRPILYPYLGYSIKSHIIFTLDGHQVIEDVKKQHSYRRNKGKNFFNGDWRDLELAFLQNLKDDENLIQVNVNSNNEKLIMEEWPVIYKSDFGYNDPKKITNIDGDDDNSETSLINQVSEEEEETSE